MAEISKSRLWWINATGLMFAILIGRPRLNATQSAASLIEDDADKPRAEAGLSTETPEVPICLQEGILRGILSLSLVVEQRKRHEVNAALVRTDQLVKEFVVAGGGCPLSSWVRPCL